MRVTFLISLFLILLATACVDRFSYEISKQISLGVSIDGFISDQPGPYEIRIQSIFDIESKESTRTPVSVKSLVISDNKGHEEALKEIDPGKYQTDPSGIRGVPGGIYKIRVELLDGRIYESLPDTILTPGSVDSLYIEFKDVDNVVGEKRHYFDVFFDASYDEKINNHFVWKFTGTFKVETHPELITQNCYWLDEIGKCNYVPACSGYRNVGTNRFPKLAKQFDCTCCVCWYSLFNPSPILSDDHLAARGRITKVKVQTIPIIQEIFMYKIRLDVSQMTLTPKTFRFWKAIRDQQTAIGNLFQPVSGKIPRNFIQVSGPSIPIDGLFFATSISSKAKYLERFQLPPVLFIQFHLTH